MHTRTGPRRGVLRPERGGVGIHTKQLWCTCRVPCQKTGGTGNGTRQRSGPHTQNTAAHAAQDRSQRDLPGTTPLRGPGRVRRRASPAPPPWRGPAAGTKSLVLDRPPRAPRSRPVDPGAQAPGMQKGTTASGKRTGAPRATGLGPRGTPERHAAGHNQSTGTGAKQQRPPGAAYLGSAANTQRTTAQEQVPGNTQPTHHKPQPGEAGYKQSAHTSRHRPRHPSQEWRGPAETRAQAHTPTPHTPARSGGVKEECARKCTHTLTPQPGLAGHTRNSSPRTHTCTEHPSQE